MVALLELLRSTHLDAAQTHMDEVMLMCTAEALALSAASHWHREHCEGACREAFVDGAGFATRLGSRTTNSQSCSNSFIAQPLPFQTLPLPCGCFSGMA